MVVYCGYDGFEFCGVHDMSADRWTTCPKCDKRRIDAIKAIEESYGKVSAKDYIMMLNKVNNDCNTDSSLREDYEQGINDGVYSVNYRANCNKCGFKYNYKFEKEVL